LRLPAQQSFRGIEPVFEGEITVDDVCASIGMLTFFVRRAHSAVKLDGGIIVSRRTPIKWLGGCVELEQIFAAGARRLRVIGQDARHARQCNFASQNRYGIPLTIAWQSDGFGVPIKINFEAVRLEWVA